MTLTKRIRDCRLPLLFLLALALTGCAGPTREFSRGDYVSNGTPPQKGMATWYGGRFNGRATASGEKFNQNDFTAAHRTLPFGTVVAVRNMKNGKDVIVQINDRGPYGAGRIIDLSKRAAIDLDMINAGVVPVEVWVLRKR